MSRFDRYDRLGGKTVDTMLAEPFTLTPMIVAGSERPGLDEDRPVSTGRGIFSERELGGARLQQARTMPARKTPVFSVDRTHFGEDVPRQGDRLELPEKRAFFDVVRADPDGKCRWFLVLAERRQPSA